VDMQSVAEKISCGDFFEYRNLDLGMIQVSRRATHERRALLQITLKFIS
jgi:hypothetical protein